ncbi:CsbD family protein [Rhizorhabdus histidinilytica]|uniref:CsbD family protein n=1 Tax=Rhizorhabdus histidinilytica TaxID=439228 RepID=UPI0032206919
MAIPIVFAIGALGLPSNLIPKAKPTKGLQMQRNLSSMIIWKGDPAVSGEEIMDWNRVEGNWKQLKGRIKEQWGKLTDDDLDQIAGRRDQLEGKIQERYGIEKDRVKQDIDDWYNRQTWSE